MNNKKIRTIVIIGILSALDVVLARFVSFNVWNMKIGTGFIPVIVAAVMLGPVPAGIVAALGDFIGAILFPFGAYFPAFTAMAFVSGIVFGLLLHGKKNIEGKNGLFVVCAVIIDQFIIEFFINTYWISVLYGSPFKGLLATRIIQTLVMTAVELVCIPIILSLVNKYGKDYLSQ